MTITGQQTRSLPELTKAVGAEINAARAIDCYLPGGGRLHIECQLPFLCLYRRPVNHPDNGTAELLQAQAAYLTTATSDKALSALVYQIAGAQSKLFGSFLLIELWSSPPQTTESEQPLHPRFHLHAPCHHTPNRTLDAFEEGLQAIRLRRRNAVVEVSFDDAVAPPGLPSLLTAEQAAELNCAMLGIDVAAVYRDPISDKCLPFALRTMRRGMSHALKKGIYRFSHDETHYRPHHYHELGSRALNDPVWQVDRQLADISEAFDLLLHVTPVNANDAWLAFEQSGYREPPEFHYRPRQVDPTLLKRQLYRTPLERIDDPTLADLFATKQQELDRQLTLLNDRDTSAFLYGSIQLFGTVDSALRKTAESILNYQGDASSHGDDRRLSADELAQYAEAELAYYRAIDETLAARVEVRSDITGILVSHGNFLIGNDAHVSARRLSATLNHEIGTHALTYHNGNKQPFSQLYAGMAGYEPLQEGLAVLAEYLSGGLDLPRLQLLAGRVIAADAITNGADFIETFKRLHRDYGFRPFTAYTMSMRLYRGGGYTKDLIYLRGLIELLDYLGNGGELELLYTGKIAMEHLHLLEELRWREVLKPIALKPRYIDTPEAQQRLTALRDNPDVMHLLENL